MARLSKTVLAGSAILVGSGIVASSNGLTIVAHASQKSDNQSTSTNTDTTSSNDDASDLIVVSFYDFMSTHDYFYEFFDFIKPCPYRSSQASQK